MLPTCCCEVCLFPLSLSLSVANVHTCPFCCAGGGLGRLPTTAACSPTVAVAAESKEEREREERILKILNEFKLQGGQYHTDMIMAKTGDRLLGVPPSPAPCRLQRVHC